LENFFSAIRAAGHLHDHPLPTEFTNRMRSYILGKNEGVFSESANTAADETLQMNLVAHLPSTSAASFVEMTADNTATPIIEPDEDNNDIPETITFSMQGTIVTASEVTNDGDEFEFDMSEINSLFEVNTKETIKTTGLAYIAGYLAFRMRNEDRSLGTPTGHLNLSCYQEKEDSRTWMDKSPIRRRHSSTAS
jgi:hypothetical protein